VISQFGTIRLSALPRASCKIVTGSLFGLASPRMARFTFPPSVSDLRHHQHICAQAENIISAPEPTFSGVCRVFCTMGRVSSPSLPKQTISKANMLYQGEVPCGSPNNISRLTYKKLMMKFY